MEKKNPFAVEIPNNFDIGLGLCLKKYSRYVKYFKILGESTMGCILRALVVDFWHLQRINIFPPTNQSLVRFCFWKDVESTILVPFITR